MGSCDLWLVVMVLLVMVFVVVVVIFLSVGFDSVLSLKVKVVIDRWALLHWLDVLDESDADVVPDGLLDLGVGDVLVAGVEHGGVHGVCELIDFLVDGHHLLGLHALGPVDGNQKAKSSNLFNK